VSSQGRREQVALACERGHSQRRACELLGVARSGLGYASVRSKRDGPTLSAMKRLAAQYPRYGYRRIRVFLRREGHGMSRHRAHRLWRLAGLQLPRRRPRRRAAASRPRPLPAWGPNHVWAYDFVFDACASGQQIKCLTVIDEFTRECLAIDVAGSIRSVRVIEVLTRLISQHGAPRFLRSDNGPEFVSHAILAWLADSGIETAHIDPGKPWQNGDNESFNGKFRDECLSLGWINTHGTTPDLFINSGSPPATFSEDWLRQVHGAHLLERAFSYFTNGVETYDKVRRGLLLTKSILKSAPDHLAPLTALLEQVVQRRS
jgi:putative transposase